MNTTQVISCDLEKIIKQLIINNPEWIVESLEKVDFTAQSNKLNYTTREMCEAIGINYKTWMNSDVKNHKKVAEFRDSNSGKADLYPRESLKVIYNLWKERKR